MLISKIDKWHSTHTSISKYFIERLFQLTDYNEIISNRHRTTNGYVLISEIIEAVRLTLNKQKTIHRLESILEEATCSKLGSSIVNDCILLNFHPNSNPND